jgi:hypothetical protein
MLTHLGADFAMLVQFSMTLTFCRTRARESDAGGELRFQKLTVSDLVGAGQNAAGRCADCCAILVETDAGYQSLDMLLGETGVGARRAGLYAPETRIDATAQGIGVARLLRMRAEHRSNSEGGHGGFPSTRACPTTRAAKLGSGKDKVPNLQGFRKKFHGSGGASLMEFKRCH